MSTMRITISALAIAVFGLVLSILDLASLGQYVQSLYFSGLAAPFVSSPQVFDPQLQVTYKGTAEAGVEHFRNIFYAKDTSGGNRFAPPVPYLPKPGSVVDATAFGAWCPQALGDVLPFTSKVVNVSENCLSLSISRPTNTKQDDRLPVIVFIHGGGNMFGSGSEKLYKPNGLVKQSVVDKQAAILVAINYRVGVFGFANSTALYKAKSTNVGLRDQRAALEWVRDHISAFGGDSHNVAVTGQSAGALDVGLHLLSYGGSRGVPFHKAHMMSGSPGVVFNAKSSIVADNTASLAEELGCNQDPGSDAALECLRQVPLDQIRKASVSAAQAKNPPFGELYFSPYVDDDYIQDRPSILLHRGDVVSNIPLVLSWVTNDAAWYPSPTITKDEEISAMQKKLLPGLGESTLEEYLSLYPLSDFEHMVRPVDGPISPQYYRAAQMTTDLFFTCPSLDFAFYYAKHSGGSYANVRLYEHNSTRFGPVWKMMGTPMWRVAHLSDVPYFFNGQIDLGDNSEEHQKLARTLSNSMVRFASSGSPLGAASGLSSWPTAFSGISKKDFESGQMSGLNIALFGGPYGTAPTNVSRSMQQSPTLAQQAFLDRRIFERCDFINSQLFREQADN